MQDPDRWLKDKKVALPCIVEPGKRAVLDRAKCERIGKDWFFFSSAKARARFVREPLRYVRALTDAVTHERFRPTAASPTAKYQGITFYFANEANRAQFAALPDSFGVEKGGMIPGKN